jgi:hypothetical protein
VHPKSILTDYSPWYLTDCCSDFDGLTNVGVVEISIVESSVPPRPENKLDRIENCGFARIIGANKALYGSGDLPIQTPNASEMLDLKSMKAHGILRAVAVNYSVLGTQRLGQSKGFYHLKAYNKQSIPSHAQRPNPYKGFLGKAFPILPSFPTRVAEAPNTQNTCT